MSDQPAPATAPVRTKNALHENKLRLVGDILKGARRPATWQLMMFGNQLRVSCYTNLENDKNNGRMEAKMDTITAFAFMEQVEMILNDPTPNKLFTECKTVVNGDWKNPVLEATLSVGRGEDKVVYVGIISADESRPRLQFRLRPTDFHALLGANRQPLPEQLVSEIYGRAYLRLMRALCPSVLDTHFTESERTQKPGGFQKGGQGGGGFQKKPWSGGNGGGNGGGWKGGQGGGNNYGKGGFGGGQNNQNNYRNNNNNYQATQEAEPAFEGDEELAF